MLPSYRVTSWDSARITFDSSRAFVLFSSWNLCRPQVPKLVAWYYSLSDHVLGNTGYDPLVTPLQPFTLTASAFSIISKRRFLAWYSKVFANCQEGLLHPTPNYLRHLGAVSGSCITEDEHKTAVSWLCRWQVFPDCSSSTAPLVPNTHTAESWLSTLQWWLWEAAACCWKHTRCQ